MAGDWYADRLFDIFHTGETYVDPYRVSLHTSTPKFAPVKWYVFKSQGYWWASVHLLSFENRVPRSRADVNFHTWREAIWWASGKKNWNMARWEG